MTIEAAVYQVLTTNAGLTAIIGSRVFEGALPQNEDLPCIVYNRISTLRVHSHDSLGAEGTARMRIQFDVWAGNYSTAKLVTDLLRAALNGYSGQVALGVDFVNIQSILVEDERVNHDPPSGLTGLSSDYMVWHEE